MSPLLSCHLIVYSPTQSRLPQKSRLVTKIPSRPFIVSCFSGFFAPHTNLPYTVNVMSPEPPSDKSQLVRLWSLWYSACCCFLILFFFCDGTLHPDRAPPRFIPAQILGRKNSCTPRKLQLPLWSWKKCWEYCKSICGTPWGSYPHAQLTPSILTVNVKEENRQSN